jgi:hypothetical protein
MPGRFDARLEARPSRRAFTTSPNDLRIRREDGAVFGARPRSAASRSESFFSSFSLAEIAFGSIKLGGRNLARLKGFETEGVAFPDPLWDRYANAAGSTVPTLRSRTLNGPREAGREETAAELGLFLDGQCPARPAWITAVASFRFCARVCSSARRITDAKSMLIQFPLWVRDLVS